MSENLVAALVLLIYFSPIFYQLTIVLRELKKGNKLPLKKLFRFLKISISILIPTVVFFFIISHTNYLNYQKPMRFNEYDKITFDNFKGLNFFKKSLYGSTRFAYIVTSIETQIETDSVSIEALFHPSRSFVYNRKTYSKDLLNHEKYHFKITELFVRKAKKKISRLQLKNEQKINYIVTSIKKEERKYQKAYDYNTFHSYVHSEQKRYEKEIDSLLNLLSEYKKSKITLNEKK
ncbi:DUF922 domain-containing protein [Tenacibaculum sp. MEBiC06402]|uniref:DUF922 domain-containing protein n=1 Tax=unclassified Tenacibaculum TaxID=2635139 RepID=UPI003B9C91E7